MTTHEYHQLLKFLYFEGYADSYEEAEYIIEEMDDEEFDSLCEEVFPSDPLVDYLLDEGYTDTLEGAEVIIENMSDEWASHILQEMRKQDKVAGKKKTPLYDVKTQTTLKPAPEGSGNRWKVSKKTTKKVNPFAMSGRTRQGLPAMPGEMSHDFVQGRKTTARGINPHGKHTQADRPGGKTVVGSKRGVKKTPGAKPTEKPVDPFHRRKFLAQRKVKGEGGKNSSFATWSRDKATNEELEVLEYLMNEGFADTGYDALVILENMSEEWRDEILEATLTPAEKRSFGR